MLRMALQRATLQIKFIKLSPKMFTDNGTNIHKYYGFVIFLYGYNAHERVN
jgi:hypothetical protein